MANNYYNPTGNPGTGSEGLSSLMRAEFALIGTAFNLVPQISTTGSFSTVFNQVGSYTFTLPSAPGTLATTANVATETTRAQAAEATLASAVSTEATTRASAVSTETTRAQAAEATLTTAVSAEATRATAAEALLAPKASPALTGTPTAPTAAPGTNTTQLATTAFIGAAVNVEATRAAGAESTISFAVTTETARAQAAEATKQAALGFTPVQQGGGASQGTNKVYIGWDGGTPAVRMQVDSTDLGAVAMQGWVTTAIATAVPARTWNNVGGSRTHGVTYTNSHSYEISVLAGSSSSGGASALVDGVAVAQFGVNISAFTLAFQVPPGSTYSVSVASIISWFEFY